MFLTRRHCLQVAGAAAAVQLLQIAGLRAEQAKLAWPSREVQLKADQMQEFPPVVTAAQLDPAGERIASAGDDHTIALWSAADGRLLQRFEGHRDWVRAIAFSPDGERLASVGNDGRILLWDIATGKALPAPAEASQLFAAVAFHPDGSQLAAAGWSGHVLTFDTTSGAKVRDYKGPGGDLRVLKYSPDGRTLAVGGRAGVIRVWNVAEGTVVLDQRVHSQRIRALLYAADGSEIVSAGEDGEIHATSLSPGGTGTSLPRVPGKIFALAMIDDDRLAAGGSDNRIHVWNLKTQEHLGVLSGHKGAVTVLDRRGEVLISGGYDTTVRIWNIGGLLAGELPREDRVGAKPKRESTNVE